MQKLKANELVHISEHVLRALAQNRIITIMEFLQEDVTKLCTITKMNLPQVLAIRNDIFEKLSAPLINGTTLLHSLKENKHISTGLERLDDFLGGGVPVGYMTELCGLADSGKTQLCLQLALNCVRNYKNTVLYIDTKGDFSAVRIQKILEAVGLSHKEMAFIMYRIKVVHIWTLEEAIELLKTLKNKSSEWENLEMIIVDSLPSLMLQFLGDNNKIGLTMLNTFVNYSRYLCKEKKICMICVNIQTRWIDQDVADVDDDTDATTKEIFTEKRTRCLGKYWQAIPYLILSLEKLQANDSKEDLNTDTYIKIMMLRCQSPKRQSLQCHLKISDLGVT